MNAGASDSKRTPAPPEGIDPVGALLDEFIDHEERAGLFELGIAGFDYWHGIRQQVFHSVLMGRGLMRRPHGSFRDQSLRQRLRPHPERWPETIRRNLWNKLTHRDLLVIPHPRYLANQGDHICPYSGPLLAGSSYSRWVIKDLYRAEHAFPILDPDVRYLEWARRRAAIGAHVAGLGRIANLGSSARRQITQWSSELRRVFGAGPSTEQAVALTRQALRHDCTLGPLYERLLDDIAPRAVVLVVHYSHRNLPLTPRARARGIPVIELQHGFVGPMHVAYNLAPGRSHEALPDYLLTFGDFWRRQTPRLPLADDRVVPVGYGWLEMEKNRARRDRQDRRRTVLFVSQGPVAADLGRAAAFVAGQLPASDWRFRFKHHPSDIDGWRARYPELARAPVEVVDRPTSIYDELATADVQVGVYSTAVFEGLSFGLDTVVMALPGHEAMRPLIDGGVVTRCENEQALLAHLGHRQAPPQGAPEDLFHPHAAASFEAFLAKLIGAPRR